MKTKRRNADSKEEIDGSLNNLMMIMDRQIWQASLMKNCTDASRTKLGPIVRTMSILLRSMSRLFSTICSPDFKRVARKSQDLVHATLEEPG